MVILIVLDSIRRNKRKVRNIKRKSRVYLYLLDFLRSKEVILVY